MNILQTFSNFRTTRPKGSNPLRWVLVMGSIWALLPTLLTILASVVTYKMAQDFERIKHHGDMDGLPIFALGAFAVACCVTAVLSFAAGGLSAGFAALFGGEASQEKPLKSGLFHQVCWSSLPTWTATVGIGVWQAIWHQSLIPLGIAGSLWCGLTLWWVYFLAQRSVKTGNGVQDLRH